MSNMHGGLTLDAQKKRSKATPIRVAAAPSEAVLALDQHKGAAAIPVVSVGEEVMMGQPVAQPGGEISAWLHAPVSGRVVAIEPRPSAHRGGEPTPCIVIANDGREQRFAHAPIGDFGAMSAAELREEIARGGIVGLGGAAFPTGPKLTSSEAASELRLLINGAECEPYISCDDMLMRERANDVVLGARILQHALGAKDCTIALEDDTPEAERALREAIAASGASDVHIVIVPSVYPAGGERQLIVTVFGVEVPHDGLPADIGVVCQNVGTAAAVARWISDREPLISRIVTVTGLGVRDAGNLEVRLGTPFATLIQECGGYAEAPARLIMGGSMMGIAISRDDVPVIKATNCVLAAAPLDLQPGLQEMPCIRCGNCSEVCPAILLPQQLHWYLHPMNESALECLGLLDCIECGCCDYVCPSQIPLVERFRQAKPAIATRIAARENATLARERFEHRNTRLARLETERREKLEAKRRAALGEKAEKI